MSGVSVVQTDPKISISKQNHFSCVKSDGVAANDAGDADVVQIEGVKTGWDVIMRYLPLDTQYIW